MVMVKTWEGQWRHHYAVHKIHLDLTAKEWYLYYLIRSRITLNVCWITLNNINTDSLFLIRSIWGRTYGHHFLTKKIKMITRWKQSLNPGSSVSILATVLCSFLGVWFRGQKRGSSLGHHVKRADILAICQSVCDATTKFQLDNSWETGVYFLMALETGQCKNSMCGWPGRAAPWCLATVPSCVGKSAMFFQSWSWKSKQTKSEGSCSARVFILFSELEP